MPLQWDVVQKRYEHGAQVDAVAGGSLFAITGADEEYIYFKGRLWKDALPRHHLEEAVAMVERGELAATATKFLEAYRLHIEKDPMVESGCSRIPNMVAVVMKDLGYFDGGG